MKKTVTIKIEVDLNSKPANQWVNKNDYFINEVDNVLERLSSITKRDKSRYSSEEGKTENDTNFKIVVKKLNAKVTK